MPPAATPRLADLQSSPDKGLPTSRPTEWRMSRSALRRLAACSCGETVLQEERFVAQPVQERNRAVVVSSNGLEQGPSLHDAPIEERFAALLGSDSGTEKLDVAVGYPGAPPRNRETRSSGLKNRRGAHLAEKMLKSGQEQLDGWGLAGYDTVIQKEGLEIKAPGVFGSPQGGWPERKGRARGGPQIGVMTMAHVRPRKVLANRREHSPPRDAVEGIGEVDQHKRSETSWSKARWCVPLLRIRPLSPPQTGPARGWF